MDHTRSVSGSDADNELSEVECRDVPIVEIDEHDVDMEYFYCKGEIRPHESKMNKYVFFCVVRRGLPTGRFLRTKGFLSCMRDSVTEYPELYVGSLVGIATMAAAMTVMGYGAYHASFFRRRK